MQDGKNNDLKTLNLMSLSMGNVDFCFSRQRLTLKG